MKKKIALFLLVLGFAGVLFGCFSPLESASQNINSYTLSIDFDNYTKSFLANERVEYVNKSEYVLNSICFHLYPNAFREGALQKVIWLSNHNDAYPNGTSYGKIDIQKVTLQNNDVEFIVGGVDENILEVFLPQKLFPDDKVSLEITFYVLVPNINHRFGYGDTAINIANFYPVACVFENGSFKTDPYSNNGDPFYSEIANYNVNITYDKDLVLASTGEQIKTSLLNGKNYTNIQAKAVRDFAFVMSNKFNVVSQVSNETTVFYYYAEDEFFEKSLQTSVLALQTYEQLFGDYPYSTLSVVQTNFLHGGMEYPNLVYISDNLQSYEVYTNVIVHEIAHQWWYNMVGSDAYSYAWQDEGLTEYSTALFYEKNPSYNITLKSVMENGIKNYSVFCEVYSTIYSKIDTTMTRDLDEFKTANEYVYIAYVKSMLMFDSLRNFLGDRLFFESLKIYFDDFKFKIAKPEDMIASFEKGSKMSLENFFESWIDGKIIIMQIK